MDGVTVRKRFSAFILTAGLMTVAGFFMPPENVPTFIQFVGLAYAVYLGGQSATDWKQT